MLSTQIRYGQFAVTAFILLTTLSSSAQKPELVVQAGHSQRVSSVAYSPEGKTLASGSDDNTIKLWDVFTGTELRTLKGHADSVRSVSFSPDGKTIASGSSDFTIKVWDVSTGVELTTIQAHTKPVTSVSFSPDGKTLASSSWDSTIKLWDVSTGAEKRILRGGSDWINSVAFSPNGTILASGNWDSTVTLWHLSTNMALRTLKGHSYQVNSVVFSSDGKTLASGSNDTTIKLWDVSSGADLGTITGHSNPVTAVAFSPDGKILASSSLDTTIKLWDVSSGIGLRTLTHYSAVNAVAFSPDGKTLVGASEGFTIRMWEVMTGANLKTFEPHSRWVTSVAFSHDWNTLASSSVFVRLWDILTGASLNTLKAHSHWVNSVAFSPDDKTLASGSHDYTVKLWDVPTGTELRTLKGHSYGVTSVAFSSDGKTLASGGADNKVTLWDIATGVELRNLRGHGYWVNSVAFSPDGTILATGSWDKTVVLWDVSTGAWLRTLSGHSGWVDSVAFSPDGKTLASCSEDRTVKLWNVSNGVELRTLNGHSSRVHSIAFSSDGKTLASGSYDETIKLWDVLAGTELRTLKGHSYWVLSVAFSLNNMYLVTGSADMTIKVWEVDSGQELASLIALGDNDWAVVSPEGLFDGSPNAWKQLIWRMENNTFNWVPIEAFFNEFYYPGLLSEILAGRRPKPPKKDLSEIDIRQPQARIARTGGHSVIHNANNRSATIINSIGDRKVEVTVEITDNAKTPTRPSHPKSSGARDVRLFRNGSLVKVWRGDVLQGRSSITLETTVPIVAGENRLTAYAFNRDNIKSGDATLTITGADSLKRKGVAYVLAVGVNRYANSQYDLKYAVADAYDFAEELKRQQAKLDNYERVEVISLADREATKANILKALTDLSTKIQPEDALFIFFAGHGTAQQNRFYLIPHDLGYMSSRTRLNRAGLRTILSHSISDEELQRAVESIDAGQMLLVIDACNSGQALEAEEKRRGPMNSKGLAQLAYEKGMYILTAAQSYQAANEAARLGHGYLTYALVEEGLKTSAADKQPKDGQVLLREWLDHATARVPQLQQDELEKQRKQGRRLDRIKFVDMDSGTERSIQRPRVFYRRETEPHPLVVARP